jgi:hypothetical protein
MALGWQCRRKSGKGRRRGGSGGVLEHEEAVWDWFEGVEESGAHQKQHLHGGGTLSMGTC